MHVLTALAGSPELARFYALAWAAIPDLAVDATVPWLAKLMPVETAMRLFLVILLLGTAGGCVALHRALFRRWSLWPLCAFLLLYNRMLLWGFLNYLAGVALALWALAAWVALERQPVALRIAVGALFATAIYLAHLAAFGAYAVALLVFAAATEQFTSRRALGRVAPALATLAPPALLFLASSTSSAPSEIGYGNILQKVRPAGIDLRQLQPGVRRRDVCDPVDRGGRRAGPWRPHDRSAVSLERHRAHPGLRGDAQPVPVGVGHRSPAAGRDCVPVRRRHGLERA